MSETPTSPVVGGPSENAFAEPSIEQMKAEQNLYNDTDTHGGRMDISRFQDNGINKAALIFDIVNQMKSGKDLYRISLPTAFICPQSMNEYILQFIIPNEYLEGINEIQDPLERMIRVTKWWMSNLCHLPRKNYMHCKPYNPILGEYFRAKLFHPKNGSETWYFAEQVSHHPPGTACVLKNKQMGITVNLSLVPRSKFHGNSVSTILDGTIEMTLDKIGEKYTIQSFPWVLARPLVFGTQTLEFWQFLKIKNENMNIFCKVEFFWKQNNELKGKIRMDGKKKFEIKGSITDKVNIKDLTAGTTQLLLNAEEVAKMPIYMYVPPVYAQTENESRKVWHNCTKKIFDNNYSDANTEKNRVEEIQRKIREDRKKKNILWVAKYFKKAEGAADVYIPNLENKFANEKEILPIDDLFKVDQCELDYLKDKLPTFYELKSKEVTHANEIGEGK